MADAGEQKKRSEWELVRMGFFLDIADAALELLGKPAELLDGVDTPADLLRLVVNETITLPADIVCQIDMSPSQFQQFLKDKIVQPDLLLHSAGQDFLAQKILEGLNSPDVEPLQANIFSMILSNPEEKARFFGRIFYLINQPTN